MKHLKYWLIAAIFAFATPASADYNSAKVVGIATVVGATNSLQSLGSAAPSYPNIRTYGYNAIADSAGVENWLWTATCPGIANAINLVAATGVATGCYVLQLPPGSELTAGMAGITCDGSTVWTAKLTALFTAAASYSNGMWGIESPGTGVCLSRALSMPANETGHIGLGVTLEQSGNGINFFAAGSGGDTLLLDGTIDCNRTGYDGTFCVLMYGNKTSIIGTGTVQNGTLCVGIGNGVSGGGSNDMTFSGFHMKNCYGAGFTTNGSITSSDNNLTMTNLSCDNSMQSGAAPPCYALHGTIGSAWFTQANLSNINCTMPQNSSQTFICTELWNFRTAVASNFSSVGGNMGLSTLDWQGTVTGLSVKGCSNYGLEIGQSYYGPNTFSGISVDGGGICGYGIAVDNSTGSSGASGTSISGGSISNLAASGGSRGISIVAAPNTTVTGLEIISGDTGIYISVANNQTIVGNTYLNTTGAGNGFIETNSSNIVFNGNNISSGGNACQFVQSGGTASNNLIAFGNRCHSASGTSNILTTGTIGGTTNISTANNLP